MKNNLNISKTITNSPNDVNNALEEYDRHLKNLKILGTVKCKQNLYKSTYEKNAFIKNRKYNIVESPYPKSDRDLDIIYVRDVEGRPFTFSKPDNIKKNSMYKFDDYFEVM
jgi:hypothetical protein